jgi:hypothetical protein
LLVGSPGGESSLSNAHFDRLAASPELRRPKRPAVANILLLLFSLIVAYAIAEVGFRFILFSDIPGFEAIRNPAGYADYYSDDDFWKLHYLWGHKPRSHLHPLLGWVGDFSPQTYVHDEANRLQGRRPVLLFGDSFAGCSNDALCFQDILNNDEEFSQVNYLLNYGVGSYGTDQILLLLQNTIPVYEQPFVVLSFMTFDMDRSILTVRTAPKPYFRVENDALSLKGVPVNSDPHEFYRTNPPQIKSYVFRRLLYGYMPDKFIEWVRGDAQRIEQKKELNRRIILEMISTLESHDLDFVFLIFHPNVSGVSPITEESDWRDPFLEQLLQENNVPYIWSKRLVPRNEGEVLDVSDYFLEDGHPTTHFNELIAAEIKDFVLQSDRSADALGKPGSP